MLLYRLISDYVWDSLVINAINIFLDFWHISGHKFLVLKLQFRSFSFKQVWTLDLNNFFPQSDFFGLRLLYSDFLLVG